MTELLDDALAISSAWKIGLDLRQLIETQLRDLKSLDIDVDIVAIGKAAREMTEAAVAVLGDRVRRRLVIVDEGPAFSLSTDVEFVIGEHPLPGMGSLMAGERLFDFVGEDSDAGCTVFLISGGSSSLCALPQPPMDLEGLRELFAAALESGADITTLNKLRAATSRIAGGAILQRVRTPRSLALLMVDNVVSGARWVASGLTYEYRPSREEVEALLDTIGQRGTRLAATIIEAWRHRSQAMIGSVTTVHSNRVVVEPADMLDAVVGDATRRGFAVVDVGGELHGDVQEVVTEMSTHYRTNSLMNGPFCVVGAGEVTIRIRGNGKGGRCQEFVWRMAEMIDDADREVVVVARASDGRDFVKGIAGGWVDATTLARAREHGFNWRRVVDDSDSHSALAALDQLIEGGRTGWNLCDVYLVVVAGAD